MTTMSEEALQQRRDQVLARARRINFQAVPDVPGRIGHSATEHGWLRIIRTATASELDELDRILTNAEAKAAAVASCEREDFNDKARQLADEIEHRQEYERWRREYEAQIAAQEQRAQSVEGRLERVEAVLVEIRDALLKR